MEALLLSFWNLSVSMGIFIVVGVLIAGVLHELIPEDFVSRHLGKNGFSSVLKATSFGIPLPLCSCSVIPFAAELKRKGASEGSVLAFLISTPITGVDSILATYGMFGWAFTLYRVLTSSIIAIIAGALANALITPKMPSAAKFSLNPITAVKTVSLTPAIESKVKKSFSFSRALHYGFISLLGGIASPLLWGLIIGAFISMMIPDNLSHYFTNSTWLGYLIAVAIAAPMYVCATASLPIAASLIMAGVSPGAAFVFLSAGPATNTVTMGVVKSMMGTKALAIYLGSIIIGSLAFGVAFDYFFDATTIREMIEHPKAHGWIENFGGAILLLLLAYNLIKERFSKKSKSCSGGSCCS